MLDQKGFDLWADRYDEDVQLSEESDEYPFAAYKDVLNTVYNIVRQKVGSVLDIGFGTGDLTRRLYEDGYNVTGIDFSVRMLEIAREKMPQAHLIQWDFSKGLPPEVRSSFDWIISTYAIHHLTADEKKAFISQLMQHLNPGGAVVFGDVAFQTRAKLADARRRHEDLWDDEEDYLVADEIAAAFPHLQVEFITKSYCSGVLVIGEKLG
ncbi:MAG: class I SAM-dependent methyltransferase [Firmicutes bacterium]|jgi:putative AdoMet-dependent methyltransferase|nr:class I SAM-dependent methyltransferase [Bacillota bacterium]NLO65620.1 class I SAM-dependent methyltransferase [Bacillota bacterium]